MNRREKKFYEKFKKKKITADDLKKAAGLAGHLGNISGKFLLLIKMINSDIKGEFKIPALDKLKIIGAILYVITPVDAVLDIIPFFGFGDDIAVVTYVLTKLNDLINSYEEYIEADCKQNWGEETFFGDIGQKVFELVKKEVELIRETKDYESELDLAKKACDTCGNRFRKIFEML